MTVFIRFVIDNARWLFVGALLAFMSSFGQTYFIAIFAGEIRTEFGLSHSEWGKTYALGTGASAVAMIWVGGLADRFRVRSLGIVVFIVLALACLFMALNRTASMLIIVIFLLRLSGQGMASHVSGVAMARWFIANRGKALAVAIFGFAIAEASLPLSFAALKQVVHWRTLWVGVAVFCVAMIPVLMVLLKQERTPQSLASTASSVGMGGKQWSRAEVLRHPLFWALIPAMLFFPAFGTAFWFQQVHFAEVKGWNHLSLVAVFPLGTAMFLVSTLMYGWLIDRFGSAPLLPLYLLPLVGAFALFWYAPSVPYAALGVILMGLAGGGQSTLPVACWAEFYGTRHLGSIKAMAAAVMVFGSALGPGLSGYLIDAGVELPIQYLVYSASFLIASVVVVFPLRAARKQLAFSA